MKVPAEVIYSLSDRPRSPRNFHRTGGLHAAGLFDAQGQLCGCGKMLVVTMHWINWLVLALLADELP